VEEHNINMQFAWADSSDGSFNHFSKEIYQGMKNYFSETASDPIVGT